MKTIKLIAAALLLSGTGLAQNYVSTSSTGTAAPFEYTTAGSTILGIPSQDVLSTWQTLPFSFTFYGQTVTGYYASDNGYITFDNSATTSEPSNTAIPDVGGPNNAIYAFWDDFQVASGAGSPDEVVSWTYGTAPNRVHVVEWFSCTAPSGGYLYAVIRLYECGDFDIIHNYGTATGMSATVGAEDATGSTGVQLAGSPNMSYPALGSTGADDQVYSFHWDQVNYDMSVAEVDFVKFATVGSNNVSGMLQNLGGTAVTSFDLHYSVDGGSAQTMSVTGVNIPAYTGTYNYTHSTPWVVSTGGVYHDLCVWADNINGNSDDRPCNDEMCLNLFTNTGTSGDHHVVVEEFTGAWCQFCPDGALVVEDILDTYAGDAFVVSIHDNDQMAFNDGIRTGFNVTAYPNAMVDRKVFDGFDKEPHTRSAWLSHVGSQVNEYTPANIITTYSYNSTTREISYNISAKFVDYAAGDMRFVIFVVEDGLSGSGTGWDQVNYYNTVSGHPYQGAGNPILGYQHRHNLRMLPAGAYGNAGVIPATVAPGDSITESFTITLPASYNEDHVYIIGALGYYSTTVGERELLNAAQNKLMNLALTDESIENNGSIELYPNPTQGNVSLSVSLDENTNANISVYDLSGKRVLDLGNQQLQQGSQTLTYDVSTLSSGMYYVKVNATNGKTYTGKLTIVE